MSAQNCQARLLFKKFEVEVTLNYKGKIVNGDVYTIEDNYNGTWKAPNPFTDFTKRELSCPKLLAAKKATLTQGWVHKNIDAAIRRDFSTGYPFPAINAGQGYAPPPDYYANQPYHVAEAVPLIDQLRSRQPFIPIINSWGYGSSNGPFYFKDEDGKPPNLNATSLELTPNETIFESQDDYQKWLTKYLPAATPVYYPGAPNDTGTAPFLFATKTAWTDFLKDAGGRGITCGGQAQCGINLNLANAINNVDYIQCTTSTTYADDPSQNTQGTAIINTNPSIFSPYKLSNKVNPITYEGYYDTYTRSIKRSGDLRQVDGLGNFLYNDWEKFPPDPIPNPLPKIDSFLFDIYKEYFLFEYFNNKQKGCGQLIEAISKIYKGNDVMPYQLYMPYQQSFDQASDDFVPFAAQFNLYPYDFTTTITATEGCLIIESRASKNTVFFDYLTSHEAYIQYKITYENL